MDLISIGGIVLPPPATYNVTISNIDKTERNAAGTTIIERIATKRKISLGWDTLTGAEYSQILNAVDPVFCSVSYFDPKDNATKSGTFYTSDRQAPMMFFINGEPTWNNIQFDLIER
jgi:hypothetical protein